MSSKNKAEGISFGSEAEGIKQGAGKINDAVGSVFGGIKDRIFHGKDFKEHDEAVKEAEKGAREKRIQARTDARTQSIAEDTKETIRKINGEPKINAEASALANDLEHNARKLSFFEKAAARSSNSFMAGARLTGQVVEVPVALGLKPVNWSINKVGNAFVKSPGKAVAITAIVGAAAAATGIGGWMAKQKSKELQAENDTLQAMVAQRTGPYLNNPEASQAYVDARIAADRAASANDNAVGNHAAAVTAARQAAPATEAATVAAANL